MEKLFRRAMSLLLVAAMLCGPMSVCATGLTEDEAAEPVVEVVEEIVTEEAAEECPAEEVTEAVEEAAAEEETEEPAEEIPSEEVTEEQTEEAETVPEEVLPVTVIFACENEDVQITVFSEEDAENAIAAEEDGTYLLLPGAYVYDAVCEGFESIEQETFTVEAGEESVVIEVLMLAEETIEIVADKGVDYDGNGNVWNFNDSTHKVIVSGTDVVDYPGSLVPENVTAIEFMNGVETVDLDFFEFTNLHSLVFPKSVTNINTAGFVYMSSIDDDEYERNVRLGNISVAVGNQYYKAENGALYALDSSDKKTPVTLLTFAAGSSATQLTLPASVQTIDDYALLGCARLSTVTIPKNSELTSIGEAAFMDCKALTTIAIPQSLTTIPAYCFNNCKALKTITIADSVDTIGMFAFCGCASLAAVKLPNITNIERNTFDGCISLTEVTIPASVTTIDIAAFMGCARLKTIQIPDSVTAIPEYCFMDCTGLTSITIPVQVTDIGDNAFYHCNSLYEVYYGGSESDWAGIAIGTGNDPLVNSNLIEGHTISYNDLLSGTNNPANPSVFNSTMLPLRLYEPTRVGYRFLGWYDAADHRITQIVRGTNTDVDLYARWEAIPYTISYAMNGGKNVLTNPVSYTADDGDLKTVLSTITAPEDRTAEGFNFEDWYVDNRFSKTLADALTDMKDGLLCNYTLYAKWDTIKFNLVLNSTDDDGNPVVLDTIAFDANSTVTLPTPKRAGYTFDGWYDAATGGNKVVRIARGTTGDMDLFARWKCVEYKISYSINGGEVDFNDVSVWRTYSKDKVAANGYSYLLVTPTRKGFDFEGWYLDSRFATDPITKIDMSFSGNIKIYAKWKAIPYTITFDCDGGEALGDITYDITKAVTLPTPVKEGYTFLGWYDDAGVVFDSQRKLTKISAGCDKNLTLTAHWEGIQYKISYVLDGGSNSKENPTKMGLDDAPFTLADPVKKGYNFLGWYTSNKFQKQVTILQNIKQAMTLYAKWEMGEYTLSFDENGGDAPVDSISFNINTQKNLPVPTRTGYTFAGWYNTDGKKVTSLSRGSAGDMTLKAEWKAIKYSIKYNMNGGKNHTHNPLTYDIDTYYDFDDSTYFPLREGYDFDGWYLEAAFLTKYTELTTGSTGNLTLYAKWNIIPYNISYDLNDSTEYPAENALGNRTVNDVSQSLTLKNPTRPGYKFAGWYDVNGKKVSGIQKGKMPELNGFGQYELTAKWTPIKYTIKYVLNGGTFYEKLKTSYTVEDTDSLIALTEKKIPTGKTGFDCWNTNKNPALGDSITDIVDILTNVGPGNITLYAVWN